MGVVIDGREAPPQSLRDSVSPLPPCFAPQAGGSQRMACGDAELRIDNGEWGDWCNAKRFSITGFVRATKLPYIRKIGRAVSMKPPRPIGLRPVGDNGPYRKCPKTLPCLKVILIYIPVRSAGGKLILHFQLSIFHLLRPAALNTEHAEARRHGGNERLVDPNHSP